MALNDFVLIDGIIDDILDKDGKSKTDPKVRGAAFEQLAISELLKAYDLTVDQIENGIVDGGDDGGIDGLFIFVNGNYLSDKADYQLPRENGKLEIYIITCKHELSFFVGNGFNIIIQIDEYYIITNKLKRSLNINLDWCIPFFPNPGD